MKDEIYIIHFIGLFSIYISLFSNLICSLLISILIPKFPITKILI